MAAPLRWALHRAGLSRTISKMWRGASTNCLLLLAGPPRLWLSIGRSSHLEVIQHRAAAANRQQMKQKKAKQVGKEVPEVHQSEVARTLEESFKKPISHLNQLPNSLTNHQPSSRLKRNRPIEGLPWSPPAIRCWILRPPIKWMCHKSSRTEVLKKPSRGSSRSIAPKLRIW